MTSAHEPTEQQPILEPSWKQAPVPADWAERNKQAPQPAAHLAGEMQTPDSDNVRLNVMPTQPPAAHTNEKIIKGYLGAVKRFEEGE